MVKWTPVNSINYYVHRYSKNNVPGDDLLLSMSLVVSLPAPGLGSWTEYSHSSELAATLARSVLLSLELLQQDQRAGKHIISMHSIIIVVYRLGETGMEGEVHVHVCSNGEHSVWGSIQAASLIRSIIKGSLVDCWLLLWWWLLYSFDWGELPPPTRQTYSVTGIHTWKTIYTSSQRCMNRSSLDILNNFKRLTSLTSLMTLSARDAFNRELFTCPFVKIATT